MQSNLKATSTRKRTPPDHGGRPSHQAVAPLLWFIEGESMLARAVSHTSIEGFLVQGSDLRGLNLHSFDSSLLLVAPSFLLSAGQAHSIPGDRSFVAGILARKGGACE
jgi:hypothetical protein